MSLFGKTVDCDKCGAQFTIDDSRIGSVKKDDLEVQYLSCPSCGAKFLIFASDSKMRALVERRKAVWAKIKMARAKKFQEKTFKKYMREYSQIKEEQETMMPTLRAAGEKLLSREDSENNAAAELHDQG